MKINEVSPKLYLGAWKYNTPKYFGELEIGELFRRKNDQQTLWKKIDRYRAEDTSNSVNGGDISTFVGREVFVADLA